MAPTKTVSLYQLNFLSLLTILSQIKKPQKRRFWVRKIFRCRSKLGISNTLIPELRLHDPEYFMQFLATGETFRSLSYTFRVGRTVTSIVRETCFATWKKLKATYMKVPRTEEEWQNIADEFLDRWQLPNCCGSIDGKHSVLQCPANTGSLNYNFKGRFSKIMAVVDAHYKFIFVDFGHYGSESDGGVFQKCTFGKKIISQTLNLPKDANLPNSNVTFPYYFVADEAFPLRRNIMRPYPRKSHFYHTERIFNYRLSRARRVVENAFEILSSRFRIFLRALNFDENITLPKIVAASLVLHNFFINRKQHYILSDRFCGYRRFGSFSQSGTMAG
ncbi:uncharacterized protein [Centruroides vittatus]|uniref:uncharacterized protein n=1 Tax=Centruroides vittatus TaxID=120091 RepID=UPI00351013C9